MPDFCTPFLTSLPRLLRRMAPALAVLAMAGTIGWAPVQAQPAPTPEAITPEPAASAPPTPRYSAAEIEQAFGYMDANKDGSISREEAAGFKGVARNFDKADLNSDGLLSKDEFRHAMNKAR